MSDSEFCYILFGRVVVNAIIFRSRPGRDPQGGGGGGGGGTGTPIFPTLGYNTQGCLRVHYCLYFVTVQSHIIKSRPML